MLRRLSSRESCKYQIKRRSCMYDNVRIASVLFIKSRCVFAWIKFGRLSAIRAGKKVYVTHLANGSLKQLLLVASIKFEKSSKRVRGYHSVQSDVESNFWLPPLSPLLIAKTDIQFLPPLSICIAFVTPPPLTLFRKLFP